MDVVEGPAEAPPNNGTILETGTIEAMVDAVREAMSSDIFTGQIIASCVILCFVGVFLLKEWITQNAPPGLLDGEEINVNAAQQAVAAPPPHPAPFARRNVRARADRVIMAQGQVEALAALDELRARGQQADVFQGLPPLPAHLKGKERESKEDRLAVARLRKRQQLLEKDPSSLFDEPKQKRGPVNRRVMLARETRKRRESDSPPTTQLPFSFSPSPTPPLPEKPRIAPRELSESFFADLERPVRLTDTPVEFGQPGPSSTGLAEQPFTFSAPRDIKQSSSSTPVMDTPGNLNGLFTKFDNSPKTSASTPASATSLRRPPLLPSTSAVLPEASQSAPVSPMASPSLATYHPPEELAANPGYFDELAAATARMEALRKLQDEARPTPEASGSGSVSPPKTSRPGSSLRNVDADEVETLKADSEDDGDGEPEVDADEFELEEEVPEVYVRIHERPPDIRPADPAVLAAAELPYELRDDDDDTDDEWPMDENAQNGPVPVEDAPVAPAVQAGGAPEAEPAVVDDGGIAIPPMLDDGEDGEDDMDGALHGKPAFVPSFPALMLRMIFSYRHARAVLWCCSECKSQRDGGGSDGLTNFRPLL